MLKTLERHYAHPVEIEYTVNLTADRAFQINLLQCRPAADRGWAEKPRIPPGP